MTSVCGIRYSGWIITLASVLDVGGRLLDCEEGFLSSSRKLYDGIHAENLEWIESGHVQVDEYLAGRRPDFRRGLSLVLPIRSISDAYSKLVASLRQIEPNQYYYPFGDLHVTVFDFIQASDQYGKSAELDSLFLDLSRKVLRSATPFRIHMDGIVFSRAAGLIQGFDGQVLCSLRESIREELKTRGIPNDERYKSESAHVTFLRFLGRPAAPRELCRHIQSHRSFEVGMELVREFEVVEHDWYNKAEHKRVIGRIEL